MADDSALQAPPDTAALLKALGDEVAERLKHDQLTGEEVRRLKQVADAFPNAESITAAAELAKNAAAIARVIAMLKFVFGALGVSAAIVIAWVQAKLGLGGGPK